MIFEKYNDDEIRSICRQHLETLETWLRQVIDSSLTEGYGPDYLSATSNGGSPLLSTKLTSSIKTRAKSEPDRYYRIIDAALLDDLLTIICHPELYNKFFKKYFQYEYPNGINELRNVFNKLIEPRNCLSHANPISHRNAQQIICYTNDLIDSIKKHYVITNQFMTYNVPRFTRFKDSFGNQFDLEKKEDTHRLSFVDDPKFFIRPGDTLVIELEVDSTFPVDSYITEWYDTTSQKIGFGTKLSKIFETKDIGQEYFLKCQLKTNNDWHRLNYLYDDLFYISYKVLPIGS